MEYDFVACKACGNIYIISGARHFCPVCSGEPLSLEGILGVVAATPERVPEAEEPGEEVTEETIEVIEEEPAAKKPRKGGAK